jgi:copper oxidase (laccase) domain-containing protein
MKTNLYLPGIEIPESIIIPAQCHGDRIVEIVTGDENLSGTDALITRVPRVTLGVRTADCAAICFQDSEKIGIAHVGWRGLCAGLIQKMLKEFNNPEIVVGPCIEEFEIQKDACYETIVGAMGLKFIHEVDGKHIFHFREAIQVLIPHAKFDSRNTFIEPTLPSYRRDKTEERMVTEITM